MKLGKSAISEAQDDPSRTKRLDEHRDFLIHEFKAYPWRSAVKLARRRRDKVGDLPASERSLRRYVQVQVPVCKCLCTSAYMQVLKQQVAVGQWRYYEPVIDAVPGVQC